jgi:3-phosphoshikimate 1-carboxyvinyltransferase
MTSGSAAFGDQWSAPTAPGPLRATVELPGSKSLTNRILILAALSESPTRITAGLRARDTALMVGALRGLGVEIAEDGTDWLVTPAPLRGAEIDCGLAGTVMRFVPPLAGLATGQSRFDGDPHARKRPMGALIAGLRQAGLDIQDGGRGSLPFAVAGRGAVPGGLVEVDASSSSQFVSALLLSGARFDKGIDVVHTGPTVPSLPHIQMTIATLRNAGVDVDDTESRRWRIASSAIDIGDTVIEPDLSNAAPFLGAALVCGGTVTIPRWPAVTDQAGDALRGLLSKMGAEITLTTDGLTIAGSGIVQPLVADLHDVSELTPVLAALCALADGESRLTGVAHIRGHETDRLAALRGELAGLGSDVTETADGLIIRPAELHPAAWHSHADHRMAQAGAVLGLAVPGVTIDDIEATTKTMADFPGLWSDLIDSARVSR